MNFDKEFSDIYYECCCAGAAGGANCISSFAPENNKGVVDIHEKDDKFIESKKIKESMEHPYDILIAKKESEKGKSIEDKWRYADEIQNSLDRVNDSHLYKVCPIFDGAILYYWNEDGSIDNINEVELRMAVGRFVQGYKDFDIEIADKRLVPILSKGMSDFTNKKLFESNKMREGMGVFDMDDDGELGVGKVNVTHAIPHEKREYFPTSDVPEDDDVYEDDFGNPITVDFEDDDDLGYDDLQDFDDDYFETSSTLDANDYDERNDPLYGYGEDDFDFEESQAMPRAIRESRALIGGSLESKEKTDYENTLEEHNKKRSYDKTVDSIDQKLTGVDSGAHGKHEWTGELIK